MYFANVKQRQIPRYSLGIWASTPQNLASGGRFRSLKNVYLFLDFTIIGSVRINRLPVFHILQVRDAVSGIENCFLCAGQSLILFAYIDSKRGSRRIPRK